MRTYEEIKTDVVHATEITDAEALLRYSAELDEHRTPLAEATARSARGTACMLRGDNAAALELYHRALALYEKLGDRSGVAPVKCNIGIVYGNTGDYPAALELYHRALALYEELGDRGGIAMVTLNIGVVHRQTGDYAAALEHYHRALALYEELGGRSGIAHVTTNIGGVHGSTGDYAAALEHYHRALALHEELGNRLGVAIVTGDIGIVHGSTGDNAAALEHYHRALALHQELGNHRGVVNVTGNIVGCLLDVGSNTEAKALLFTMDSMQIGDTDARIVREVCRATLQERSGDLDGAAVTLQRALAEALEHGLRAEGAYAHKALRDLALKQNNFTGYVEHNNEYTRITDEINGKETSTKLAMQEAERKMAKERSEHEKHLAVLHSTLPKHIADRVARGETVNDHIDNAAVMFVDIVGFTTLSSTLTSQQVTTLLDAVFGICDEACKANGVTRIKTIGDSYLAVGGLEEQKTRGPVERIANASLQIIERIKNSDFQSLLVASSRFSSPPVALRVGLHCGPITAGVLGKERLQYDVWGDTVNVASRMESTGEPNRIHVSEQFAIALSPLSAKERGLGESSRETLKERGPGESSRETLKERGPGESSHMLAFRGETEIKGKGMMQTFWLEPA